MPKTRPAPSAPKRRTQAGRKPGPDPSPLRFAPIEIEQVAGYVDILVGSYPLFITDPERTTASFLEVLKRGYPELIAGTDPDGRIVGVYAFFDFVATILGRGIPASGLGMVGTALDRKKSRVALQLVRDYVRRTRRRAMPLSFLYPFRHDFYADMGWAPVGQEQQYCVHPSALPLYPERASVFIARDPDWRVLDRIHRQYVGGHGGLGLSRHAVRWHWMISQARQTFLAGPKEVPEGYVLTKWNKRSEDADNFHYDLEVLEMEWTTPRAMRALIGFLASQRDQVLGVILNWPRDQRLEAILREPVRRGSPMLPGHMGHGPVVAQGVMLRLEDPEQAFALRPYHGREAVSLEVSTRDPLFNDRPTRFRSVMRGVEAGRSRPRRATLTADLLTLSGLWSGALRLTEAVEFGLAQVAPASCVVLLDDLLLVRPPHVTERF
jgi:predicted acetyltransferase